MKTKVDFLRRDLKALQADRRDEINNGECDRRGKDIAKMQYQIRKLKHTESRQPKHEQWM